MFQQTNDIKLNAGWHGVEVDYDASGLISDLAVP